MAYLLRRAGILLATVAVASLVAFWLIHALPGDPATAMAGLGGPAAIAHFRHQFGLDKPLWQQYFIWAGHFVAGDFGQSYQSGFPVTTLLAQTYPKTLELILTSQALAFCISVPMAMVGALRADGVFDRITTTVSFGFYSAPPFVVGPLLIVAFAVQLHWLPSSNWVSPLQDFGLNVKDMILPAVTLALGTFPAYAQLLRAELVSTLQEPFIDLARAKGLSNARIMLRHALRPSTVVLVTVAGLQVGTLVTGAFIVEILFHINGIGNLLVQSVSATDRVVVLSLTVLIITAVALVNFLVDACYPLIDPRLRDARAR